MSVTLSLGANDLFALVEDPTFLFAPREVQRARVQGVVDAFAVNAGAALAGLRAGLDAAGQHGAEIVLLNYYNPLNAFLQNDNPDDDVFAGLGDLAVLPLNEAIADLAAEHGARLADVYSAFLGREAAFTHVLAAEDVHPTDAGYAAIAGVVIPAPGAGVLLAAGGLVAFRRRRG